MWGPSPGISKQITKPVRLQFEYAEAMSAAGVEQTRPVRVVVKCTFDIDWAIGPGRVVEGTEANGGEGIMPLNTDRGQNANRGGVKAKLKPMQSNISSLYHAVRRTVAKKNQAPRASATVP